MVDVVVYTTPACSQCFSTKRLMDKKGVQYREVDISKDIDKLDELRGKGFTQAPIVEVKEDMWSGFRFDKINELANEFASAEAA